MDRSKKTTYNIFRNYNNCVRGVVAPLPVSQNQDKMLKKIPSYSYKTNPTCNGYYNINGSCSN